jgi:EAL domain-containing protein (putative c-di-GMP-specific phosphodiesterase class I)
LVLWNHPSLGLLLPYQFIPWPEETGLSVLLGEWVLHEACRQAASWNTAGKSGISVSVSVSPRQVSHGSLVPVTKRVLAATGPDPRRLCLEIAGQLLLEHREANLASIDKLRKMGIAIAIDDVGAGYSSLSYIRRFHPSRIKIDCSPIRNVTSSRDDGALVHAAISMAHGL